MVQRWTPFTERGAYFHEEITSCTDNTFLKGFWQSPEYFSDIRGLLLEELTPKDQISERDAGLLEYIKNRESIALHVRRGDYVASAQAASVHGVCSSNYYSAAFKRICEGLTRPVVLVFSDDIDWTKRHMVFDAEMIYVDHHDAASSFLDLRLMAECKHYVIANSSFSWWAAWLGQFEAKQVVAPSRWSIHSGHKNADLIPSNWMQI